MVAKNKYQLTSFAFVKPLNGNKYRIKLTLSEFYYRVEYAMGS